MGFMNVLGISFYFGSRRRSPFVAEFSLKETEAPLLAVRMTLISAFLVFLSPAWDCRADEPLEDLLSATFRITDGNHSGTCFFVSGNAVESSRPLQVVLVTAAHVFEQMSSEECELILRKESEDKQYSRSVVSIQIRDGDKPRWTRIRDIDIATLLVDLPEDVSVKPFALEQIVGEAKLKDRTVRVGQETWIACFPAKLEANEAGWPVLRKGSIASYPLTPVTSNKTILVSYNVFGGDSGAPVAVIVDNRPLIVGVASGMQRQTDKSTLPFEERTMHTPLGLSIAVQAHYLRETIELMMEK